MIRISDISSFFWNRISIVLIIGVENGWSMQNKFISEIRLEIWKDYRQFKSEV